MQKNRFEKFARIFSRRQKQTTFSDAGFLGVLRVKCAQLVPRGENRQTLKKSDQWSWRRCYNETVTVLSKGEITISKWPSGVSISRRTGIIFIETHQGVERNLYAKLQ